jgi:hypothetical protein
LADLYTYRSRNRFLAPSSSVAAKILMSRSGEPLVPVDPILRAPLVEDPQITQITQIIVRASDNPVC